MSLTGAVHELVIGRNKDSIHDLCDPFTARTGNFGTWLLNSQQQSEEGEEDAVVELSHGSLTDYHPEEPKDSVSHLLVGMTSHFCKTMGPRIRTGVAAVKVIAAVKLISSLNCYLKASHPIV
ncbi:uncharacterized protein LOC113355599 [Papaver somniferum]|nr:uncharacterized protein LOC113355599 [Papaver somniferum]